MEGSNEGVKPESAFDRNAPFSGEDPGMSVFSPILKMSRNRVLSSRLIPFDEVADQIAKPVQQRLDGTRGSHFEDLLETVWAKVLMRETRHVLIRMRVVANP